MCNLYRMTKTADEAAKLFDTVNAAVGSNLGAEIYPGYPGMVVHSDQLQSMNWGFPLRRRGAKGQMLKAKPVNNARSDRLAGAFWKPSFEHRRCLIPMTSWAEAQGEKGAMTRTYLSVPGEDVFAAAGLWRSSDEWGDVYSMIMTNAAGAAAQVHTRMPVLIRPEDYRTYLSGDPADAFDLCTPWAGDLVIDRTQEPWARTAQARLV